MARNYRGIDLKFTEEMDYVIDETGDLADTSDNLLSWLKQEVLTRLKASSGDWAIYPDLATNLEDFIGEPNSRGNAMNLALRIKGALTHEGLISPADLNVKIVPISIHAVMVLVEILSAASQDEEGYLKIGFVYDVDKQSLEIM